MKNKIIKGNFIVGAIACTLCLPITSSYAKNLWSNFTAKPTVKVLPTHQSARHSLLASDPSSEIVTIYAYNNASSAANNTDDTPAGLLTTTATTQIYGSDSAYANSASQVEKSSVDVYTGCSSVVYHGIDNKDTTVKACDALQRPTAITETDHDLAQTAHTTHEQITYTLSGDTQTVAVAQLDNKNTDGTPYTTYTQTSLDKKLSWNNMPQTGITNTQQPAMGHEYTEQDANDLGQTWKTTHYIAAVLQGKGVPAFSSQTLSSFDAQNRVTKQVGTAALDVYVHDAATTGANQQINTQITQFDDVANQVTSYATGAFALDGNVDSTTALSTPRTTKQLNDQQQVTSEQVQAAPSATGNLSTAALFTNTMTYDNLGQQTGQATRASQVTGVSATSSFNALGLTDSSIIGKGTNDAMTVNFSYADLNNKLTTKSVKKGAGQAVFRYNYVYDMTGNVLREYRGIINKTDGVSKAISQDYHYSKGGYQVTQTAWHGATISNDDNTTTQSQYGDVHGQRVLLQQVISDGHSRITINNTYDYATGKQISESKTVIDADAPERDQRSTMQRTFLADGRVSSVTYGDSDNNDMAKTSVYHYADIADVQAGRQTAIDLGRLSYSRDFAGVMTYHYYRGANIYRSDLVGQGYNLLARVNWYRDGLNKLTQKRRASVIDSKLTTIDTVNYAYNDSLRHLTDIDYQDETSLSGDPVIGHMHYVYDNTTNNVIEKTQSTHAQDSDVTTTYTYDPNTNQLLGSSVSPGTGSNPLAEPAIKTSYTRDTLGNLTDSDKNGTLRHFRYSQDGLDRLISISDQSGENTYDSQGNLLQDINGNTYQWDIANREKRYTDKQGNTTTYGYPVYGRDKSQHDVADGSTVGLQDYYLGGELINEFETGAGKHNHWQSAYLGRDVRVVLDIQGNVQQTQFLRADQTGTMKATLTLALDPASQTMTVTGTPYDYNDQGDQKSDGASSNRLDITYEPLRFNGDYHDQETNSVEKGAKTVGGTDYKLARSMIHLAGVTRFMSDDYGMQLMNRQLVDDGDMVMERDAGGHMGKLEIGGVFAASSIFVGLCLFATFAGSVMAVADTSAVAVGDGEATAVEGVIEEAGGGAEEGGGTPIRGNEVENVVKPYSLDDYKKDSRKYLNQIDSNMRAIYPDDSRMIESIQMRESSIRVGGGTKNSGDYCKITRIDHFNELFDENGSLQQGYTLDERASMINTQLDEKSQLTDKQLARLDAANMGGASAALEREMMDKLTGLMLNPDTDMVKLQEVRTTIKKNRVESMVKFAKELVS